jgi:hypothetical protein
MFFRIAPGRAASRLISYSLFEGRPLTTKGRWWNPVVFGNLRFASGRAGKPIDRPVFIVGMGRSGTTLLGRILSIHPSVGFLNEPKAMWHVIREDQDILGSYAPPRTGRLYLGAQDADEEVSRRGRALFSWYLRASRSKRVIDKYPELVFRHPFIRAIFPDARFLIAVRSPWSILESVAKWSESHSTDEANWWGMRDQKWEILWTQAVIARTGNSDIATMDLAGENDNYVRAAVEWIVSMREAISLAATDPLAQVIRYEELVQHPREVIRKTLCFCELPASSRTEAYADAIISTSTQDGGDSRTSLSHPPDRLASRLPDGLTRAIDETWSQLHVVDKVLIK